MDEAKILYCFRSDVSHYIDACNRLLYGAHNSGLTLHEREVILLFTRKLIEEFL